MGPLNPISHMGAVDPIDHINVIHAANLMNSMSPMNPSNPVSPVNPMGPMNPLNLVRFGSIVEARWGGVLGGGTYAHTHQRTHTGLVSFFVFLNIVRNATRQQSLG